MRARPRLTAELQEQLAAVPPSIDGGLEYRPCEVDLVDGSTRDCVYVQEAGKWFSAWGVDPEDDPGKEVLALDEITAIRESPTRLPVQFANAMYNAGESAMGGCWFRLVLRDGRTVDSESGNAVDFPDWPEAVSPSDVVQLIPHRRSAATRSVRPHVWALYSVQG